MKQVVTYAALLSTLFVGMAQQPNPQNSASSNSASANGAKSSLEGAMIIDKDKLNLRYILQNCEAVEVATLGPGKANFILEIVTPSGRTFREGGNMDLPAGGVVWPIVKPGETKIWDFDLSLIFSTTKEFRQKGLYRISARLKSEKVQPNQPNVEFKSNDVLLVRDVELPPQMQEICCLITGLLQNGVRESL